MNRSRALELLAHSKPTLAERYGVVRLALFGSTARDAARSDSDIDILVAFDGPATSERYLSHPRPSYSSVSFPAAACP